MDPTDARRAAASRLGFLALLRRLERRNPDRPRIGRNARLSDEVAVLGQDASLAFPAADLSDVEALPDGRTRISANVLGFFGPQGALPLHTTEEAARWSDVAGDRSFVAFAELFMSRFLQLFFRAWSDSRAIGQFDHPQDDRFQAYVSALSGVSTPAFRNRDGIPDISRTYLVGLHATRIRSAVRLRQLIELYLGARLTIEEHVMGWIAFEQGDRNAMGMRAATLGRDMALGARVPSVNDRIRLRIRARDLDEYTTYLPGGRRHGQLQDLARWYLGMTTDVVVALSLPAHAVPPARLGAAGQLGWMAALAPDTSRPGDVTGAEYTLEEAA